MTTRRSHPPSLITRTRATLKNEIRIARGDRILIATSGGPDSMALLHVLASLRTSLAFDVVAHGVDHGLRDEASAELDLAETLARSLDIFFSRTRVHVESGGNLQARARTARYAALRSAAHTADCAFIATAHHADDRAETILSRLLRGAGPIGLAVLRARQNDLLRPFIRAGKSEILDYTKRHQIIFADDPSNRSPRFLRTRIRHELMPLLTTLNPAIVTHLCALADQLAETTTSSREITETANFSLSRETRTALQHLAETRRGEVLLPRGLIVRATKTKVV